jgi:hypothetical protein
LDILPTKETGYKWTYAQCIKIGHLLQSRNLSDKFGFIFDYRSASMNRYGIRDIQKYKDKPFINEPNIKANPSDIYRGE